MALTCNKFELSRNFAGFPNNGKTNEDRPVLFRQNYSPLNVLFSFQKCIGWITLISHGVPPIGGVKQGSGGENKPFSR